MHIFLQLELPLANEEPDLRREPQKEERESKDNEWVLNQKIHRLQPRVPLLLLSRMLRNQNRIGMQRTAMMAKCGDPISRVLLRCPNQPEPNLFALALRVFLTRLLRLFPRLERFRQRRELTTNIFE